MVTRKCIITGAIVPVEQLVRFDYDKQNQRIILDVNKELKGRGAYFIPTRENWNLIMRNKGLNRAFRTNVSKETYLEINNKLEELKWLK
nr:YlxR family protein [Mycoplasmopsis iners]